MAQEIERTLTHANGGNPLAHILVVDDEAITCTMCATVLTQAGYTVTATTDVNQALGVLRGANRIDLLLADIQMPDVSGLELAQVARELDPAMAVIIMTGHTSADTLHAAARSGSADFLSKPFELEELRFAVDQALHKRELLQEQIRLRAYEQLFASSSAISSILDQAQLSTVILQRARHHIACSAGFLVLYPAVAAPALVVADPPEAVLLPEGLAFVEATSDGGRSAGLCTAALAATPAGQAAAAIAAPLSAQGQPLGVLVLCSVQSELVNPTNQEILAILANHAGAAVQNARLYSELQRGYHSLAELDRLKSEFIAIASHELRSPLAIVLGYAKMVRDQSSGDHREYAQRVLDSAQQIRSIVEKMIDLRDYDRDRADLIFGLEPLGDVVRRAIERLTPAAELKGQRVALQLPPNDPLVRADREKLLLMIGNLIDNAIKFGAEYSQIRVELAIWTPEQLTDATAAVTANPTFRRLSRPQPERWAIVSVADEGIGIPHEAHAQIFERFYQVADSLTRKHGGTGLGLALVSDLIRLHEGLIWLESALDQGSTFFIALPYALAKG
jgi:signal transduction histidine kinase